MKLRRDGRIRYSALTEEEIFLVANGCGAKQAPVPDWGYFMSACGEHDLRYWEGGTEADRAIADREFHINMHRAARSARWYLKWPLYVAARVYFQVVKLGGSFHFHYGKRRGLPELERQRREMRSLLGL